MKTDAIRAADVVRGGSYLLSLSLSVFLRCQFGERVAVDLCIAWGLSWVAFWIYSNLRLTLFPLLPESVVAPWYLKAMLFLQEQAARFGTKKNILDVIDSRMESETLHEGVQKRLEPMSPSSTSSEVVELPDRQANLRGTASTIVDQLEPELRQILTPTTNPDSTPSP